MAIASSSPWQLLWVALRQLQRCGSYVSPSLEAWCLPCSFVACLVSVPCLQCDTPFCTHVRGCWPTFLSVLQVRSRCVSRAVQLQSSSALPAGVEQRIANLYAPDLSSCWGIECVQVAFTFASAPRGPPEPITHI